MKFIGTGEKTFLRCRAGIFACCAICVLCVAIAGRAQAMQAPSGSSIHTRAKAAAPVRRTKGRAATSEEKAATPKSPSEAAARPAIVNLKNGRLTIEANNSELAQILQDLAGISGMKIEGLNRSTRVFGVYGPGNPSDVLSKLLAGSGYNFVMAGKANEGVPRELLLSAQSSGSPAPTPADPGNGSQPRASTPQPNPPTASAPNTPAPSDTEDPAVRAERRQQNLRRLQQMYEQQEQNAPH